MCLRKLEMATKIADFCSHALLALDVRTHPRAPYLERKVPVSHHENKSPAVHAPSSKLVTIDEASAVPDAVSSHHQAPEGRSTSFEELFGSECGVESESKDSIPDIVDFL
ncbi:hypothetical protein U9M48_024026 [Paspalum notatum var. saurae]|uniref:Uncharacterized protein n=1 Tax=Paspalum notatum var. saurae TaxID=547442 RepID=A0AAQ3TMU9_PASNO